MPILELPPNPSRSTHQTKETTGGDAAGEQPENQATQPIKVRTRRYGELEEHELIHLLDSLDDERSRARFRESIYISVIIYLAVAWFLFYGPRVLFHQPEFRDPIAMMKQHDKELTYITPRVRALKPPPRPVIDRKTMQQLQKQQARVTPPTPQPPQPQPQQQPPPQEQARTNTPQPPLPLPAAPKPAQQPTVEAPLPSAPRPNFAQNAPSARDAIQNALRGGRSGADIGSAPGRGGPLQAGATILSDQMGVDFSAYMRRLHNDIQRNWDPLIPLEVEPPLMKRGVTGIRFTILPNGAIGNIILESPSRDEALDRAAWGAITSEGQFPPLPKEFHGPQLELRVGFYYNTPVPQ